MGGEATTPAQRATQVPLTWTRTSLPRAFGAENSSHQQPEALSPWPGAAQPGRGWLRFVGPGRLYSGSEQLRPGPCPFPHPGWFSWALGPPGQSHLNGPPNPRSAAQPPADLLGPEDAGGQCPGPSPSHTAPSSAAGTQTKTTHRTQKPTHTPEGGDFSGPGGFVFLYYFAYERGVCSRSLKTEDLCFYGFLRGASLRPGAFWGAPGWGGDQGRACGHAAFPERRAVFRPLGVSGGVCVFVPTCG